MRVTMNNINKAIKAAGHDEQIFKGRGYFYFVEGESSNWPATMVMTCHLTDLTVDQWVREHFELKNAPHY